MRTIQQITINLYSTLLHLRILTFAYNAASFCFFLRRLRHFDFAFASLIFLSNFFSTITAFSSSKFHKFIYTYAQLKAYLFLDV